MELRIKGLDDSMDEKEQQKRERAKQAKDRKKKATETLSEAWERIFNQKNSDADLQKLREVKAAMDEGIISRDPSDMVTKKGTAKRFSKAEAKRLYDKLVAIKRRQKLEEMRDNLPDNYELIQTEPHLAGFLEAMKSEEEIVFDVETTGTDIWEDEIVGVVLTLPTQDKHAYIPTNHETDEPQLDRDRVLRACEPFFADPVYKKIAHNGKFDIHMLTKHGVEFNGLYFDTQTAMHVLNENEPTKQLKVLATKYLRIESETYSELFGSVGFHKVSDLKTALAYAAKDGDITWKLKEFQMHHLERTGLLDYYFEAEAPLTEVIVRMERAGFVIDNENAEAIGQSLRDEIADIDKRMREMFGVDDEFNFNSPKQLVDLLYGQMKLDRFLPPKLKGSTDKNALKILKKKHDGVALLLEYRDKSKLLGTYFEKLPTLAKSDGRLHGEFQQDTTVTGRFSSKNPNLQNQPDYARRMYKAPEGYVLLTGDWSQQEPRILTHFTQEPALLDSYLNDRDLYTNAAADLFGLPVEECGDGSKWRKIMKMGILAVMYGTGAKTLGEQLDIPTKEAEQFISDFYRKYTRVSDWQNDLVKQARRDGFVRMLGGRKRRVPDIKHRDEWKRYRAERQVKNSVIQGSAAVQAKLTLIALDKWARKFDDGRVIALQVHDEVGIYVPADISPQEVKEFEDIMLHTVEFSVPNKTDIEAQVVWGDSVDWDSEAMEWVVSDSDGNEVGRYETPKEALEAKGDL